MTLSHNQIEEIRAYSITTLAFVKLKNSEIAQRITKGCYETCFSSKKLTKPQVKFMNENEVKFYPEGFVSLDLLVNFWFG